MGEPHPIDPYLSLLHREIFTTEQKDELLAKQLQDAEQKVVPTPPEKPDEPKYEDIDLVPYHPHTWGEEWDGDYHQGRICDVCGEMSDCDSCNPNAYDDGKYDCWRVLAEQRNWKKQKQYKKAMERYEAQMDYWRTITNAHAAP